MRRAGSVVQGLWLALGIVMAVVLAMPPEKTGQGLGLRRFLTVEVSREYPIAQRFRMNAPDLTGIEIRPAAVGPVRGRFRLVLRDRDGRDVERSIEVAAADLVREGRYQSTFAPIGESAGHEFQFEMLVSPSDPGRGVALWASKGGRPEGSALRINNAPRWASLAFQTETPAVSLLRRLVNGGDPSRPPRWLALVGFAASWVALRFVLNGLLAASDRRRGEETQTYVEAGL